MGGMKISLLFRPPAIASSTSLLLLLRTLGWPNQPWLPELLPDLSRIPENQDPMLIVGPPSPSLAALVRFPQPPIQAELFGSSPVLSFTSLKEFNKTVTLRGGRETEFSSLIEELHVAVAEQELLVEESALPESFLLASSKAEATSILPCQGFAQL